VNDAEHSPSLSLLDKGRARGFLRCGEVDFSGAAGCAHDFVHVVAGAAIDGPGLQRIPPHLLIGDAVSADEPDTLELARKLPHIANVHQAQVNNHDIGAMTMDHVSYFIDIARDAYALEVGMQLCCEVFGHNAVRLGHDHIVWFHDSLSFTAPKGGG
jgi:hypothetical protein